MRRIERALHTAQPASALACRCRTARRRQRPRGPCGGWPRHWRHLCASGRENHPASAPAIARSCRRTDRRETGPPAGGRVRLVAQVAQRLGRSGHQVQHDMVGSAPGARACSRLHPGPCGAAPPPRPPSPFPWSTDRVHLVSESNTHWHWHSGPSLYAQAIRSSRSNPAVQLLAAGGKRHPHVPLGAEGRTRHQVDVDLFQGGRQNPAESCHLAAAQRAAEMRGNVEKGVKGTCRIGQAQPRVP